MTYSRADMINFPDCDLFAKCVLEVLREGKSTARVEQWAACLENHSGNEHNHYHMAIKLSGTRCWYGVSQVSIVVTLQHIGMSAKIKQHRLLHSPNHVNPAKLGSPRNKNAMKQFFTNAEKCRSTVAKKASDSETQVKKQK